jgi:Flp pilus assembly protein TadG
MVTHKLRRRRHRGAAAVEFALVVPLLVMILFGIMEFGYAFFIQSSVAGAARVGVRSYAINWTKPSAQTDATTIVKSAVPDPLAVLSVAYPSPCTTPGTQTTVVITYQYHSLTGLLDALLGPNIKVTGKGSMACGG